MGKRTYWMVALVAVASLQLGACAAKPAAAPAERPSHTDPIPNSKLKKVTLTEKAMTRLDVQTAAIMEEQVTRKRKVGGEVVATLGDAAAAAPANGTLWVRVNMTDGDLSQIDNKQPIRVLPLDDEEGEGEEAEYDEDAMDGGDEPGGSKSVFYMLRSKNQALQPGQRMLVELVLKSDNKARKVVPYSAIIYDTNGDTWVYTNPEGLSFVRAPIQIDYIADQMAYLTDGPAAGTKVVTNGTAELYGAETGVGK